MGSTFAIGVGFGYGVSAADSDIARGMCLQDAARLISERYKGGVPALAEAMGVSANTLQHKLNPNNKSHKLTLDDALAMQQISRLPFVLHAMAGAMAHSCMPEVPDQSGGDPVEAFMRFQQGMGEFTAAVADALIDGNETSRNAFRRVEARAGDLMALVGYMVAVVAQRVPEVRDAA
ncbi:MAG: phage regulatory CII family protein [Comamonas sp.]